MDASAILALSVGIMALITSSLALLTRAAKFIGLETRVAKLEKELTRHAQSTGMRLERNGNDIVALAERIGYKRKISQIAAPVAEIHDDSSEDGE